MIELKIPKLGMTMESANLVSWQLSSGDEVKKEEIIFTIETDKITYEVPSPADGIFHPVAKTGAIYPVSQTVGYLAENRDEYGSLIKEYPSQVLQPEAASQMQEKQKKEIPAPPPVSAASGGRIKASHLARSMAAKHHLDLRTVAGTGPRGRIVRADILRVLESVSTPSGERVTGPVDERSVSLDNEIAESIPIAGVRKVIYDNMCVSLSQCAQLTIQTEVSAEALIALRNDFKNEGEKISYNAILVKVSAMALRRHPKINASVDADTIRVWKQIHIGLAMEANDALIVPVVLSPDYKSIREIEAEIKVLIQKAEENRLLPGDLGNGTFTITNLGFADIDHFTPIIRPPESAILGIGRIVKKPIVKDEQVVAEARMGLSLTFDHRIIDGAPAARFLKTIKDLIEKPMLILM